MYRAITFFSGQFVGKRLPYGLESAPWNSQSLDREERERKLVSLFSLKWPTFTSVLEGCLNSGRVLCRGQGSHSHFQCLGLAGSETCLTHSILLGENKIIGQTSTHISMTYFLAPISLVQLGISSARSDVFVFTFMFVSLKQAGRLFKFR